MYQTASDKIFKLDSERALFTLRYQHNGVPPDFELLMYGKTNEWFEPVALSLFGRTESPQAVVVRSASRELKHPRHVVLTSAGREGGERP